MPQQKYSTAIKYSLVALLCLLALPLLASCERKAPPAQQRSMPQVSYITVQQQKVVLTRELPGRTSPYAIAQIRPRVSGLIQKRLFTEGSDVNAGQVLYQIDPEPFIAAQNNAIAALNRSQAKLPAAQLQLQRITDLLGSKAVSQQDYDNAVAAVASIKADIRYWQAAVKTARINYEYTKVRAPISGRIGISAVTDGAIVSAYQPQPLTTIQQLDPIYVDIVQSTTELLRLQKRLKDGRLKHGHEQNKVKLTLDDGSVYPLKGDLQFSDVTVDPTTGSVTLRAIFANPQGILLPGMFVRAQITEGVNEHAILVPQQGVARDPRGNPYALIVDADNKAALRPLTVERAIGDKWLVTAGLAPGDKVIVEGLLMLRPGTPVKAAPFTPAPAAHAGTSAPDNTRGGK